MKSKLKANIAFIFQHSDIGKNHASVLMWLFDSTDNMIVFRIISRVLVLAPINNLALTVSFCI